MGKKKDLGEQKLEKRLVWNNCAGSDWQCEGFDGDRGGGEGFGVGAKDEEDDFGSRGHSDDERMGGRAGEQTLDAWSACPSGPGWAGPDGERRREAGGIPASTNSLQRVLGHICSRISSWYHLKAILFISC